MKALITKELLENRIYMLGALAATAVLLALGVPLDFYGEEAATGWVLLAALPALAMGLATYSRDISDDTLSFTLSRPVRWWQVYLSKVTAGLIACAAVGVASGVLHLVFVAGEYRPFVGVLSVLTGAANWAGFLAMIFSVGFLATCALPGAAVSKVLLLCLIVAWLIVQPALLGIYAQFWPSLALLAALVVASVACSVSPLVLETWPRFRRWLAIIVAGFAGMAVCAVVGARILPSPPEGLVEYSSPDRQLTAHGSRTDDPDTFTPGLWITMRRGPSREIESRAVAHTLAWSGDSRTLYYAIVRDGAMHVRAVSEDTEWKPADLSGAVPLGLPKGDRAVRPYRPYLADPEEAWSPSGRRLLIQWEHGLGPQRRSYSLTVVDVAARKAWRLRADGWVRHRWLDDGHLVTTNGQVIRVSGS